MATIPPPVQRKRTPPKPTSREETLTTRRISLDEDGILLPVAGVKKDTYGVVAAMVNQFTREGMLVSELSQIDNCDATVIYQKGINEDNLYITKSDSSMLLCFYMDRGVAIRRYMIPIDHGDVPSQDISKRISDRLNPTTERLVVVRKDLRTMPVHQDIYSTTIYLYETGSAESSVNYDIL